MNWLSGRIALVLGDGVDGVASVLAAAGAEVRRHGEMNDVAILVHGGSCIIAAAALDLEPDRWRMSMVGSLDERFFAAAAFARARLAAGQPGVVLMVSEVADGVEAESADAAIATLVMSLAAEWARDGIRVIAINQAGSDDPATGALAAYLASDYGAYVTGCTVGTSTP